MPRCDLSVGSSNKFWEISVAAKPAKQTPPRESGLDKKVEQLDRWYSTARSHADAAIARKALALLDVIEASSEDSAKRLAKVLINSRQARAQCHSAIGGAAFRRAEEL